MKSEIKVGEYYMRKSKDLTNLLFDKRFLSDDLSRESVDWLEDYLGFIIQTECQMAGKSAMLIASLRDKKGARS